MVKYKPLKASAYTRLSVNEQGVLVQRGAIPVNDVFYPFWKLHPDIHLLYGSYGSGKSKFICAKLLHRCLTQKYFKCYYGRKILEDVRQSVHSSLCTVISDMGWQKFFKYSTDPNGSMVITCRLNGNKFIPFGAGDVDSLKSIDDPTDIFCEEFDQFDEDDFKIIYPRLRTSKAKTQFWGAFNTAPVFPTHWILKYFFPDLYDGQDKAQIDILEGLDIQYTFANYVDNYFIDHDEYYQKLKLASGGNILLLKAIAEGEWGVPVNNDPWLQCFDPAIHIKEVRFNPSFPVYLSFDFNRQPMTCTAWQKSPSVGLTSSFIHAIDEFVVSLKKGMTFRKMCAQIKNRFPQSILYVTGDCNGNSKHHAAMLNVMSPDDNSYEGKNDTHYRMIRRFLNINQAQMNLNSRNLEHSDSRLLCNTVFSCHANVYISPKCKTLIADCQIATVDDKSSKASHLKKDRGIYKMDVFDTMRYFFQTYLKKYTDLVLPNLN